MCGIAGFFSAQGRFDKSDLQIMTEALRHRGPDADGFYMSGNGKTGLGHRRLSILDLSEAANQPMFSQCGRYVMVFNGEIYNYKEIALKLKAENPSITFTTTSDTEVILRAYIEKGTRIFAELNGMFAIAIFDQHTGRMVLARDHIGIKPLFYYWDGSNFAFSSELKAIKSLKGLPLSVDFTAIPYFLHLGYIPEPQTIYREIKKFPSGHYLEILPDTKDLNICPYWQIAGRIGKEVMDNEQEAATKLKSLLFDAVEKQLISDVPIGTFLSGGIDSSIVTAIATKVSTAKVKTFNIGFADTSFDESSYAGAVAKHLGTDHHTMNVREKDAIDLVPQLMQVYDEPFADSSAIPTMLVSGMARKHVTVALSGDGGDELFLGYGMYNWAERLNNPFIKTVRKPLSRSLSLLGSRYRRVAGVLDYPDSNNIKSHIFSQEQKFFSEQELAVLLTPGLKADFSKFNMLEESSSARVLNVLEKQSFWDMEHYLKDDLLVKVDRASMQYSLESRVPLLDFRLIEFSLNLHTRLKKKGENKFLLKKVLYELVPKEIFDRPKRGFGIPLHKWLKNDLRFLVEDFTNEQIVNKYGIVDYKSLASLKRRYFAGDLYLYNRLWVVILLHWWLSENVE